MGTVGLTRASASVCFLTLTMFVGAGAAAADSGEIRGPWVAPQLGLPWEVVEQYSTPVYRTYIIQGLYVPPGMTQSEAVRWASDDGRPASLPASDGLDPPFSANVRVNDQTPNDQSEISMAVDKNGNLYAGWNDNRAGGSGYKCGFALSTDGGKTWSANELIKTSSQMGGDPVVVVDNNGSFYRLCMGFSSPFLFYIDKSTDGGATWNHLAEINGWDKPWMAAYNGKIIVIGMNGGTINQVRSTDDGKTWDTPKSIGGQQGACITEDSAGALYAAWGLGTVEFVRSSDWGDTWSAPVTLGPGSSIHGSPRSASLTGCDVSDDGKDVYIVWSRQAGSGDEVVVAHSGDGGATFGAAVKVNDGAATSRAILPWVCLDSAGTAHAAWLDNRDAKGDAYYANSSDGGKTWGANMRVNDASPGAAWVSFIGDYTNCVITPKGEFGYIFEDNRDGTADTWYSSAKLAAGGQTLAKIDVAPNPGSVAADKTLQFTATGTDTNGQPMTIKPTWSATGGTVDQTGLFTPDKVGAFEVSATVGAIAGKAPVTVTPGALAKIDVAPAIADITADETKQFTAKGSDAKGNDVTIAPTWSASGGTPDSTGLYTPDKSGTFTVTAEESGVKGTAQVTVKPGKPTRLEVQPPTKEMRADEKFTFAAVGHDAHSNPVNLSATWSVDDKAKGGMITSAGLYTPDKVGQYTLTAEAQSLKGTAQVTVKPGKLDKAVIEPKNTTISVGDRLQYAVNGTDVKGNAIPGLSVTWKVITAPGSISTGGEFAGERTGQGKVLAEVSDGSVKKTPEAWVVVKENPLGALGGSGGLFTLLLILVIVAAAAIAAALVLKRRKKKQRAAYYGGYPGGPGGPPDMYGAPPPYQQYPQPYQDPYQQPYQQPPQPPPQQWGPPPQGPQGQVPPPPGQQW